MCLLLAFGAGCDDDGESDPPIGAGGGAGGAAGSGGAIAADQSSSVDITNVHFTECTASENGGARLTMRLDLAGIAT